MQKRGIFKTTTTRTGGAAAWKPKPLTPHPDAIAEIDYRFAALKPYLSASRQRVRDTPVTRTQSIAEHAENDGLVSRLCGLRGLAFQTVVYCALP